MLRPVDALTVRDLTRRIKELLECNPGLTAIWVKGEISNYKRHSSGHLYFTLKDDSASIKCVMFKSRATGLRFEPEDGMAVLVFGSVGVYERDGQYQLYVEEIQADGIGSLFKAFLQLKARLEAEGLFDKSLKRPLPALPRKLGVVTSLKGAAVRDIINIARRRWPGIGIVISDVLVQGDGAPQDIIRGLELVCRVPGVDVVIVGRGGGSIEELWAFNSEALARAIRACPVPVISAVGHETDFTIADFVADVRAPTPSAAAELAVPDSKQISQRISIQRSRMVSALKRALSERRYALSALCSRPVLRRGLDLIEQRRQHLDDLDKRLADVVRRLVQEKAHSVRVASGRLDALSPLRILSRGYSIVTLPDGTVLKSSRDVETGQDVNIRLARGRIGCVVKQITE